MADLGSYLTVHVGSVRSGNFLAFPERLYTKRGKIPIF
jgi:hypothetical protein